ncbi:MAG TPA: hypothetical protein VJN64_09640 [Terriglobales bacterium]|nr:hypothetical protein [Terriglobales bacterium]
MRKIHSGATWIWSLGLAALIGLGAAVTPVFAADQRPANADAAFAKLKTLVGTWEAESSKGKAVSTYELIANGTALVEHIKVPGESEMLTVYHLDGDRLLLTHYCTAGNQPEMQAEAYDPASNQLTFNFVRAGNLPDKNAGHMHSAVLKFTGADAFTANWAFQEGGKIRFVESLPYTRVK